MMAQLRIFRANDMQAELPGTTCQVYTGIECEQAQRLAIVSACIHEHFCIRKFCLPHSAEVLAAYRARRIICPRCLHCDDTHSCQMRPVDTEAIDGISWTDGEDFGR